MTMNDLSLFSPEQTFSFSAMIFSTRLSMNAR